MKFFKRFNEIKYPIRSDTHIHTDFSHGKMSVSDIINKAIFLNLDLIAFTDHYEQIINLNAYVHKIDFYRNKIKYNITNGINVTILMGLEVNVQCPYQIDVLKEFDVLIGSFHGYPVNGVDYFKEEYDFNISIIENPLFHILGHAGGQSLKFLNDFPIKYFEDLIKKCVEYDTIFELNYARHFKVKDILIPLLKKYNPYVSFGSDAHNINDIGKSII